MKEGKKQMKSLSNYEEIPTKVSALEVDQSFDQTMKMLNQDQEDYEWNFHQLKSTIQDELGEENEKITYNYILKIQNNRIDRGEEFSKIEFQSSISSLEEVSNLNFCSLGVDGMNLHSIEGTDRIHIQSNGVYLYDREDADQSIASFNSENILFPEHTAISANLIQGTLGISSIPNLNANAGITIDYSLLTNVPADQGITKASQMTGDFWDGDLNIPAGRSIYANATNYSAVFNNNNIGFNRYDSNDHYSGYLSADGVSMVFQSGKSLRGVYTTYENVDVVYKENDVTVKEKKLTLDGLS